MTEPMLVWGLALIGVGLLLIAVEVFVPSGGLIAVTAGIAAIAGVVCLWRVSVSWGIGGTLAVLALGPTTFFFMLNLLPSTPMGRALIGADDEDELEAQRIEALRARDERHALLDAEGEAVTDLRPIGKARIEGQVYEVLAQTHAIDAGTRVRVTRVTMSEIKVRAVT